MREDPRATLRKLGLTAKKGLGQHFLVDEGVLVDILQAADLKADDIVVEIGPGLGVLTEAVARRVRRVTAVELDERLVGVLKKRLADRDNVKIVQGNVLEIDPESLVKETGGDAKAAYKVVANLPYYITSPILRHFLEAKWRPKVMVIMVQREVAEVIAAGPGGMSLLSVSVQFYGQPSIVQRVSAENFYPPPKVASAIVKIEVREKPALDVDNVESFFRVVAAGFSSKRKQIHNSLERGLSIEREQVSAWLERAGIDGRRRAQTLSLEEWGRLYEACGEDAKIKSQNDRPKCKKGRSAPPESRSPSIRVNRNEAYEKRQGVCHDGSLIFDF